MPPIPSASITFYPDCKYPDTGLAQFAHINNQQIPAVSWAALHNAAAGSSVNAGLVRVAASITPQMWWNIIRHALPFVTTGLPSGIVSGRIFSAKIRLWLAGWDNGFNSEAQLNIYAYTPADPGNHTTDDFDQFGATPLSDALSIANHVADAYNDFELNSEGIQAIVEGVSKFSVLLVWDAENSPPVWVSGVDSDVMVRYDTTPERRPQLVVVYEQ